MKTSEHINELAAALAKAQAAFPKVVKDRTAKIASTRGEYSYKYADLATLLEAVRKPLAENGLALTQPIEIVEANGGGVRMVLHTMLLHVSGQCLDSFYPLTTHDRPQEMGSEITYSRRYAIGAILGIASEDDDDGNAAQQDIPGRYKSRPKVLAPQGNAPGVEEEAPFKLVPEHGGEQPLAEAPQRLAPTPKPEEEDRGFLQGGVQRRVKERDITDEEKKVLGLEFLGKGASLMTADVSAVNDLYQFLGDAAKVAEWRKKRAQK